MRTHQEAGKASICNLSSQPFFQAKLTVNTPGDVHEQEADQVADQVMRMRNGDVPILQRMPLTPVSSVMRKCAGCEEKEKEGVQRKETGGGDAGGKAPPSIVSDVLSSGGGRPMESGTRHFMESRFGQDFSQVRIHTGTRAAESASAIQARAYTSGRDVVFGGGEYQPGSEGGKHLLAHELAHVVQQRGAEHRVQRAEIGYRQLTWSDFKGSKTGEFDAVTVTRITPPNLTKAKPDLSETDTKTPCQLLDAQGNPKTDRKGDPKMDTTREVAIKIKADALELKSKMNQNRSAAKSFFKNKSVRTAECKKTDVKDCKGFFKDEAKAGRSGGSFGSATDASECTTKLLPECEARKQAEADNLLVHEQGHFDLTEAFARSGTAELKTLAAEVGTTTVSGCGKGAGKKEAEKTMKGGLFATIKAKIDEIKARFEAIALNKKDPKTKEETKGELWQMQEEYDADADHNQNTEGQAKWNEKLKEMLKP